MSHNNAAVAGLLTTPPSNSKTHSTFFTTSQLVTRGRKPNYEL